MKILLLLPILFPLLFSICLTFIRFKKNRLKNGLLLATNIITCIFTIVNCFFKTRLELFHFTSSLTVVLKNDELSMIFSCLISFVFLFVMIYNFTYLKKEKSENRFYSFYLATLSMLIAFTYAGNLLTLYLFFEMITLISMPLVLHSLSKEAISAALKYLFYSIGGAFLALFGIFFLVQYCGSAEFDGMQPQYFSNFSGNQTLYQVAILLLIIGFCTKAGMFPLHGWLPTAHPVAPAPASAVLSGVITNAGVFAVIRVVYYIVGTEFLQGSFVQYVWLGLASFTVLMGSLLALCTKNFKKRLAYSTVSQISYILCGLALFHPTALIGAILHVIAHSLIKVTLFLYAGEMIYQYDYHDVGELKGIGKKMPVSTWCYTIASLGLIGIPLTFGFTSKWYLATGAVASMTPVFCYLVPGMLLISAILTAGYLLPITIRGFFATDGEAVKQEAEKKMLTPLITFATLIVLLGIYATPLVSLIEKIIRG